MYSYGPVIDGHFLTDYPSVLMADGKYCQVPSIISTRPKSWLIPFQSTTVSAQTLRSYNFQSRCFHLSTHQSFNSNTLTIRILPTAMWDHLCRELNGVKRWRLRVICKHFARHTHKQLSSQLLLQFTSVSCALH